MVRQGCRAALPGAGQAARPELSAQRAWAVLCPTALQPFGPALPWMVWRLSLSSSLHTPLFFKEIHSCCFLHYAVVQCWSNDVVFFSKWVTFRTLSVSLITFTTTRKAQSRLYGKSFNSFFSYLFLQNVLFFSLKLYFAYSNYSQTIALELKIKMDGDNIN